jgi:hypothetical protein
LKGASVFTVFAATVRLRTSDHERSGDVQGCVHRDSHVCGNLVTSGRLSGCSSGPHSVQSGTQAVTVAVRCKCSARRTSAPGPPQSELPRLRPDCRAARTWTIHNGTQSRWRGQFWPPPERGDGLRLVAGLAVAQRLFVRARVYRRPIGEVQRLVFLGLVTVCVVCTAEGDHIKQKWNISCARLTKRQI